MAAIQRNSLGQWTYFENFQYASDYFKVPFLKARSMFLQFLPKHPIEPIEEALIYVEDEDQKLSQSEADLEDIFNIEYRGNLLHMSTSFTVRGQSGESLRMQVLSLHTKRPTSLPQAIVTDKTKIHFCAKIDWIRDEPWSFLSYVSKMWGCSRT